TNQVARDVSFAIPEVSVEVLRLVHFLVNHAKVQNPSQGFLKSFESLFTPAGLAGGPAPHKAETAAAAPVKKAGKRPAGRPARRVKEKLER
ncbi:MAG TPA: hypothetical protein VMT52_01340, partial [Planctomycetota bacterium]|nr:hypothetical protein [Planctomycetota bacterium]